MLFGTAKRLANNNNIHLELNGQPINNTKSYCYLGNQIDSTLTLNDNFDKTYKKACGRLHLLDKMREYLNVDAAYKVFEMVIMPLLLYSTLINLQTTATQQQKLSSIERRARRIIGGDNKIFSITKRMKKSACTMVRRCLDDKLCSNLQNYFEINEHIINTRNQNKLIKLPKVKLEFGKKSFRYQGAKCFNPTMTGLF